MTSTSTAFKRWGVAAVAALTLGGGLPLALSGAASANDNNPRLIVASDGFTTAGSCETFTVERHDAGQAATPTATITVTVTENEPGSLQFCNTQSGTILDQTTDPDGQARIQFGGSGTTFTFGLIASQSLTGTIFAAAEPNSGFNSGQLTTTFQPAGTPPPSATPTATTSPGGGTGTPGPTATSSPSTPPGGGTASPTASNPPGGGNQPSTPPGCARAAEVMLGRTTIIATGTAPLSVTGTPNSVIDVFAYSRPSTTYRLVRSGTTDSNGNLVLADLRPPTNTRLYAQQRGCAFGLSKVLNVRTQISLNVVRNGVRTYTFSGSLLPARPFGLIASLYRVTNDGRQILTSQTRANANVGQPGYDARRPAGSYTINRRFTGTGRFGFVVRTGQDLQNAPGSSNVRSLLVF